MMICERMLPPPRVVFLLFVLCVLPRPDAHRLPPPLSRARPTLLERDGRRLFQRRHYGHRRRYEQRRMPDWPRRRRCRLAARRGPRGAFWAFWVFGCLGAGGWGRGVLQGCCCCKGAAPVCHSLLLPLPPPVAAPLRANSSLLASPSTLETHTRTHALYRRSRTRFFTASRITRQSLRECIARVRERESARVCCVRAHASTPGAPSAHTRTPALSQSQNSRPPPFLPSRTSPIFTTRSYELESGGLNEAFSDIIAASVADWAQKQKRRTRGLDWYLFRQSYPLKCDPKFAFLRSMQHPEVTRSFAVFWGRGSQPRPFGASGHPPIKHKN